MSKKLFLPLVILALMLTGGPGTAHAATGSQLMTQFNCVGCHNPIPTESTTAAEVTAITNAINTVPAMASLKGQLTAADIQAIAAALVPLPPTASGMPLPAAQEVFPYDPIADPVTSSDPGNAMPIGLGAVAAGGDTLTLHITANFQSPVDIYVSMYTPSPVGFMPLNLKTLNAAGKFVSPMSTGLLKIKKWQTAVTSVDQTILNAVPLSQLKKGLYYIVMTATPSTERNDYYQWVTYFIVQ
jgi:hypothetical protein